MRLEAPAPGSKAMHRNVAGNPVGSDYPLEFFYLLADANHDRYVNTLDFNVLATHFGMTGKEAKLNPLIVT